MKPKRLLRPMAGLAAGLAVVSIAAVMYAPLAMNNSSALLSILLVTFVAIAAGACVIALAVRWWSKRPTVPRPERAAQTAPASMALSAGWWGVLAACALWTVVLPPTHGYGLFAAVACSVLAGWSHPDKLLRYVGTSTLTLMIVFAAAGMLVDALGIFAGLIVAPFVIIFVVPAGAVLFMAGGMVRTMADQVS